MEIQPSFAQHIDKKSENALFKKSLLKSFVIDLSSVINYFNKDLFLFIAMVLVRSIIHHCIIWG